MGTCDPVVDIDDDITESGEKAGPISVFHDYGGDKAFWIAQCSWLAGKPRCEMVGMSRAQAEKVRDGLTRLLQITRK